MNFWDKLWTIIQVGVHVLWILLFMCLVVNMAVAEAAKEGKTTAEPLSEKRELQLMATWAILTTWILIYWLVRLVFWLFQ